MENPDLREAEQLLRAGLEASRANDVQAALACFAHASKKLPGAGLPHFLSGSEYAAMGDMQKAEAAMANAVLLSPDLLIARYQLGLLQFSSARASAALVTWAPLLDLPADSPFPHFVRGFAALAQDRFDEAAAHYRQGQAFCADNPALSSDIDKVIARIEPLCTPTSAEMPPPSEHTEAQAHVLLANYQQHGRPH